MVARDFRPSIRSTVNSIYNANEEQIANSNNVTFTMLYNAIRHNPPVDQEFHSLEWYVVEHLRVTRLFCSSLGV